MHHDSKNRHIRTRSNTGTCAERSSPCPFPYARTHQSAREAITIKMQNALVLTTFSTRPSRFPLRYLQRLEGTIREKDKLLDNAAEEVQEAKEVRAIDGGLPCGAICYTHMLYKTCCKGHHDTALKDRLQHLET